MSTASIFIDPPSTGAGAELWIGESGILVALTMVVAAVIFSRGRWTIRWEPEAREGPGVASPASQTQKLLQRIRAWTTRQRSSCGRV